MGNRHQQYVIAYLMETGHEDRAGSHPVEATLLALPSNRAEPGNHCAGGDDREPVGKETAACPAGAGAQGEWHRLDREERPRTFARRRQGPQHGRGRLALDREGRDAKGEPWIGARMDRPPHLEFEAPGR